MQKNNNKDIMSVVSAVISTNEPMKDSEVAELTGYSESTIKKYLTALEATGSVKKTENGWIKKCDTYMKTEICDIKFKQLPIDVRIKQLSINSDAHVVSFMNKKGGTSKTTQAYAFARYLHEQGKNVLLIDADIQCNLTQMTIQLENMQNLDLDSKRNIASFIERARFECSIDQLNIPYVVTQKQDAVLCILNGSIDSIKLANSHKNDKGNLAYIQFYESIQAFKKYFEYIIIDTNPSIAENALNEFILCTTDIVIVPIDALFASAGLCQFMDWATNITTMCEKNTKRIIKPNILFNIAKFHEDTVNIHNNKIKTLIPFKDMEKRLCGRLKKNTIAIILKHVLGDYLCNNGIKESRSKRYKSYDVLRNNNGEKGEYNALFDEIMSKINISSENQQFSILNVWYDQNYTKNLEDLLGYIESGVYTNTPLLQNPSFENINSVVDDVNIKIAQFDKTHKKAV
jgi:cellulose biosynthesis protein BcsQ